MERYKKICRARTTKAWRAWLERNHEKESSVILISYKKHTGKKSMSHRESMEEAICFGWIDTIVKKVDEDRYARGFVKRNKNSRWSKNTFSYAERLIKEGKMTEAGLKAYQDGLKFPPIDANIPKNPDMPKKLKEALDKDKKAKENFQKFAPSYKKMHYRWILAAKRPETIEKRIKEIVKKAKENKKA